MNAQVKNYEVDLSLDPSLPTGVWDPAWTKSDTAIKMAQLMYAKLRINVADWGAEPLQPVAGLPVLPKDRTELRKFKLEGAVTVPGTDTPFRGGSYGEIFRRFAFGARPAINFHAQACGFGVDATGRYYVQAQVGRVGGGWGNRAALQVHFMAGGKALGGVAWEGALDGVDTVRVLVTGTDATLQKEFAALDEVLVSFSPQSEGV